MHIVMIFSTPIPPREGIGFYAFNLTWALLKAGHRVTLAGRGGVRPTSLQRIGGIPVWRVTFLPSYPFHTQVHSQFLRRWMNTLEPEADVLHIHSPLESAPETDRPLLVTVHTPTRFGIPYLPATTITGFLSKLQSPFSYRVEKKLFHRADRIVATSRAIANELCSYQIDPKTVGILGNGVDTDEFYPDPNAGIEIPPYIFASGRLIPGKGWEDLLKCARFVLQKIPQVRFLLAGSGYLEKSLKAEAERLDVSANVFWLGHVNDRVRLADLYRRASVFVNPSQYEGLSTSLLEAMACARPIVATSIGGTADLLRNGENALLVESQNPKTMAEGILQILARPDLGSRLGDGALETIRKDYSWRVVSQKYLAEYQRLLEKRVRQ